MACGARRLIYGVLYDMIFGDCNEMCGTRDVLCDVTYIYIYRERERDREILYIYICYNIYLSLSIYIYIYMA